MENFGHAKFFQTYSSLYCGTSITYILNVLLLSPRFQGLVYFILFFCIFFRWNNFYRSAFLLHLHLHSSVQYILIKKFFQLHNFHLILLSDFLFLWYFPNFSLIVSMFSFMPLNLVIIAALKSLFDNFNIWIILSLVTINCFFWFENWAHFSVSLVVMDYNLDFVNDIMLETLNSFIFLQRMFFVCLFESEINLMRCKLQNSIFP